MEGKELTEKEVIKKLKLKDSGIKGRILTWEEAKKIAEENQKKYEEAQEKYAIEEARRNAEFNPDMKYTIKTDNKTPTHTSFRLFVNGALAGNLTLRNKEFDDFEDRVTAW